MQQCARLDHLGTALPTAIVVSLSLWSAYLHLQFCMRCIAWLGLSPYIMNLPYCCEFIQLDTKTQIPISSMETTYMNATRARM